MIVLELLKAIFYGILEGVTEWLPISSTGHIILLSQFLPLDFSGLYPQELAARFFEMFEVVIQLGASLAVAVLFFDRLNPFCSLKKGFLDRSRVSLWIKIGVACMPSAAAGIFLQTCFPKLLDSLYTPLVVSATLIIYGALFIAIERVKEKEYIAEYEIGDISYVRAFSIGCFQALAIIPGTSRSGATVIGARCFGMSRRAAAEFSFFMALPTMLGASVIKAIGFFGYLSESGTGFPAVSALILIASFVTAFAVSLATIRFLISFAAEKGFAPFGVYRIILGIAVIVYFVFVK